MATFTRKDVWKVNQNRPWDPLTEAYAKAVTVMQARPATDPTSWSFQAAIHASYGQAPRGAQWNQCQHQSWYFLPWHRMYLYFFERIVRAAVRTAGGPNDFALPYWNYSEPFPSNTLPQPFRQARLTDGKPNPLFLRPPRRTQSVVNGFQLPSEITSDASALAQRRFSGPPGPGFGGGKRSPAHFGGSVGALEQTPHNDIHVQIGGTFSGQCQGGYMIDPSCAALDPIFWLHHANIDRLWNRWVAQGRQNPTDAAWLTQRFTFYDEDGNPITIACADVVNTATQLEYDYDDATQQQILETMDTSEPRGERPPELVAASAREVDLKGQPVSVPLTTTAGAVAGLSSDAVAAGAPEGIYLNVEDIEAAENPGVVYGVYLESAAHTRRHVGNVSLFGVEAMNDPDRVHDGVPGFRHTFDITGAVASLSDAGEWDPATITVVFEPLKTAPPPGQEPLADLASAELQESSGKPVRIGRVSMFVAR